MAETIYKIDGSRETDGVDKISKTKRKQQMLELQDLGEELVALSKDALKKTPMSDELREAIKEYQRIPTHGAHRRQMQYIGKIMRNEDTAPIIEKLKQLKGSSTAATALLHRIERYRTEMIAKDEAITQFLSDFPSVEAQPLRALVRNARKEAEQAKPPKAYRELFQLIKTALETPVDDDDDVVITDNSIEE
jgi:ribosome-associated protein